MKEHYCLSVHGDVELWHFDIMAEPEDVKDWLADGLDVTRVIEEEELSDEDYEKILGGITA